jgi:hypothetical protein
VDRHVLARAVYRYHLVYLESRPIRASKGYHGGHGIFDGRSGGAGGLGDQRDAAGRKGRSSAPSTRKSLRRRLIDTVRCAPPYTQLLTGIPLGVIQVAASNFIAESSPARLRGPLAATIGMANVVGIILGIATGSQVIHYAKSGKVERAR